MGDKLQAHELVQSLKSFALEIGRIPKREEFIAKTGIARSMIDRVFGSYTLLLAASGLSIGRKDTKSNQKFKYVKSQIDGFHIHTLDLEQLFSAAGNPASLKIIAQPDTHVENMDERAVGAFRSFCRWYRPHGHIITGDFLDAEGISHWESQELKPREFKSEVVKARKLLHGLKDDMNDAVLRVFIEGNHEDWIKQALAANMPEFFYGMEELGLLPDLNKVLELDDLGFQQIPLNHILKIGKAHFTHGLSTSSNHPADHLKKLKANIYYGHLHDIKNTHESSITGIVEAQSLGCLCRLDAKFMKGKPTNWVHAFGIFEFFPNGEYTFTLIRILNGRFSYNGMVFGS